MSNREFTATRTMLANGFATAGAELLDYMGTAAALAAIPNTDPPRYVVAGTLAMIAKVLPSADAPAAATVLTDERIAGLAEFTDRSIREHADFRDDIGRLSTADSRTRKALRKEIYDTIDARVRNAVKAALAHAGVTAEPVDLHNAIMNLPADVPKSCGSHDLMLAYKIGHRDARHAAAELALSAISAQVPAAEVRAAALEEAAKLVDTFVSEQMDPERMECGLLIADTIRSLAHQSTADKASEVSAAEWQPIATVPMDGSEVLLYLPAPYNRVVKARWFDIWENWIEGEFPDPHDEYCGIGSLLPTYWMNLPAAPSTADSAGTGAMGEKGGV